MFAKKAEGRQNAIPQHDHTKRTPLHHLSETDDTASQPLSHLESLLLGVKSRLLSLLPPSALAILSLTSHTLRREVSKTRDPFFVLNKKGNEFERARFLVTAFDKEYPEHFICYACGVFHARWRTKKSKWMGTRTRLPASTCEHAESRLTGFFETYERSFRWLAIHETMRSHRHTPSHGSKKLHFTSEAPTGFNWWQDTLTIFVHDRLLFRERWFQIVNLQAEGQRLVIQSSSIFCPHARDMFNGGHIKEAFHGAVDHVRKAGYAVLGSTYKRHRCPLCPTEITIDIEPYAQFDGRFKWTKKRPCPQNPEYVLSFSRYVDFGACIAPDEEEWIALTTRIQRPLFGNNILPGWPEHAILDLRWRKPTSLRFRRYTGLRKLVECAGIDEMLGTPPPYQECTCQVHCPRAVHGTTR